LGSSGGGLFLLDMGQAVKIIDLARRLVKLSGLTVKDENHPDGDIEIKITDLRPEEKPYEDILIGDNPEQTAHPRILKARETFVPQHLFKANLQALELAIENNNSAELRAVLLRRVSGFTPDPRGNNFSTKAAA
jgi:FlaA1/EpsC-like NDP-sugar epimerase